MAKRIGLYPGTFDPITNGHLDIITRAAKLVEPGKDQPDDILQTQIRIKPQTHFAVPDVTERDRQAQFAPARLRSGGIKHPRPENPKLKLADTALHTQKQAVIGLAGIVDAIVVNDTGLDKSAQLQKMVPVAAISREP